MFDAHLLLACLLDSKMESPALEGHFIDMNEQLVQRNVRADQRRLGEGAGNRWFYTFSAEETGKVVKGGGGLLSSHGEWERRTPLSAAVPPPPAPGRFRSFVR